MNWRIEVYKDGTWWMLDTFDDDNPVSLNYRMDDIKELSTKKKNPFTKSIKLPGTQKNQKFFENVSEISINLDDINIKRSLLSRIISENDSLVFIGNLILIEIEKTQTHPTFIITITGTIKGLDVELGNTELIDLIELDKYNHDRTIENQIASMTYSVVKNGQLTPSIPGDGYVYPYIINGNTTDVFNYSYYYDLYPAVYVKTIWDSIFNTIDRTYTSDFINSDYFKKLIIPFSGDKIQLSEEDVLDKTTIRGSLPNGPGGNGAKLWHPGPGNSGQLPSNNWFYSSQINYYLPLDRDSGEAGNIEFTDNNNQFDNNVFTTQFGGYYDIDINLYFYPRFQLEDPNGSAFMNWTGNADVEWRWELQKVSTNGATIILDQIPTNNFTPSNQLGQQEIWDDVQAGIDFNLQLSSQISNIWLNEGDIIRLRIGIRPRSNFKWQYSGVVFAQPNVSTRLMLLPSRGDDMTYLSIKPSNNDSMGNEFINLRTTLPKMKNIDFITDISKLFNLVMVDDPINERNLIIEPADDYFASGGEVKDWNDKIDFDNYNIKPMSEINFKDYIYKYTKDDDFYNKEYTIETGREWGDLSIELDNNFSKRENGMNIKFAPTPNSDQFLQPPKQAPFFVNDSFEKKSAKPRILFYDGLKSGDLILRDKPVDFTDITINGYPYCGMWDDPINPSDDLSFSEPDKYYFNSLSGQYPLGNLFNRFHRRSFNNIADPNSKLLTGYFNLTSLDIKTFDYRDKIYLFGQYWRINLIEDWDPTREKLTKVELYRIIDVKTNVPLKRDIPTSNNLCPVDVRAVRTKKGLQYISPTAELTKECCDSIGGVWKNGMCSVRIESDLIGDIIGKKNKPIIDQIKSKNTNANTLGDPRSVILGENNYQKNNVKGFIIGNNSTQLKSSIIIGDNISTNDEASIYLPDGQINDNGEVIKKYNKIESGTDVVRPLFSKNPEWNLIRSGTDCIRELDYVSFYNTISGNNSERIGYPQ